MKRICLLLLLIIFLLVGCENKNEEYEKRYEIIYDHLNYCWIQSLEGVHFDNAFYGDSRVIGGSFTKEFSDKSVVNLGVGGDKVNDLIKRVGLIDSTTPKMVFLAIGGNDCCSDSYSKEKFEKEYETLIDLLLENECEIVVHNIVGLTTANSTIEEETVKKANKKIDEANGFIKEIAKKKNCTFIDIASKMNKEGSNEMNADYSVDGVHFNERGYRVWYDCIRPYLH